MTEPLLPDRAQLERFVSALFRYAEAGTYASLRAFHQFDAKKPPILIDGVEINGDLRKLAEAAAFAIEQSGDRAVFAPPICTFTNRQRARAEDLANGLALSVEIDEGDTSAARIKLESLIGPATIVMQSGSEWVDPVTGEVHPKRHIHWRLTEPTREAEDHEKLRQARDLAARLVGADPTGKPIVHPLRWAGSWNVKNAPKLARIEAENYDAEVSLDETLERLEEAAESAGLRHVDLPASGTPEAPQTLVEAAMAAIPNPGTEVHYDTWIRFGYAVHRATAGTGLAIWDEWSRKSEKYNAEETHQAWRRIGRAIMGSQAPRTIGAGTIFFHAKAHGWDRPRQDEPPPYHPDDPGWTPDSFLSEQDLAAIAEVSEHQDSATSASSDGTLIDPRNWTAPAPLRQWLIQDWIPIGYVTGLYGDGGLGKSLLGQQLISSVGLGLPWLGMDVRPGYAVGLMCEDDNAELNRRQESINRDLGVEMSNLENIRYWARLGFDNILMTFDADNIGKPTKRLEELLKWLDAFPPRLVVIDTLADTFGGNEINRNQARQYVQGVGGRIARQYNCAVVISGHPSVSGLQSGSGTSGSTAWNNTFRSRLYLARPSGENGQENPDQDTRTLSRMKANYAPSKAELMLRWQEGVFRLTNAVGREPKIDQFFIDAVFDEIDRAWKAGEAWSTAPQTQKEGRYLPLWMQIHHGVSVREAGKYLNSWMTAGYLKVEITDARKKEKGLRVIRRLQL